MIIDFMLVLVLIHYIGFLLYKPKTNNISCGIFAWAGKSSNKFDKSKFNILGIFNDERGGHSCGVAVNGDIFTGIDSEKLYKNFITSNNLELPKDMPTVIGHTRKATYGKHTVHNAHPFGFGNIKRKNEDPIYRFIGVHNGTLLNHKELAKNFNVKLTARTGKNSEREKIDSEIILEAIYRNKNFKVLEEYNGAAALVFQDLTKPNVIYCYHGASKKYRDDPKTPRYTERPLFYYKETRNSLYISSIEESLQAIGGTEETIGEFDTNTVYEITDGNIAKAKLTIIDRDDNFINKSYGGNNYRVEEKPTLALNEGKQSSLEDDDSFYYHQGCNVGYAYAKHLHSLSKYNIHYEEFVGPKQFNKVKFSKMRYWQGKDLVEGIFTYISGFGFYYLGKKLKESEQHFNFLVGKPFYNGEFIFDYKDVLGYDMKTFIPFEKIKENEPIPLFYFYAGINVETLLDYNIVSTNEGKRYTVKELSYCSVHPVTTLIESDENSQNIIFKGNLVNDTICPLGSDRIYTIEGGNCTFYQEKKSNKIKTSSDKKVINLNTLTTVTNELEKFEANLEKKESEKSSNKDKDIMFNIIDEIFKTPLIKFPEAIKRLDPYTNNVEAVNAIAILEDFLTSTRQVIDVEPKE